MLGVGHVVWFRKGGSWSRISPWPATIEKKLPNGKTLVYFFGPDESSECATAKNLTPFVPSFRANAKRGIKSEAYMTRWQMSVEDAIKYELERQNQDADEILENTKVRG